MFDWTNKLENIIKNDIQYSENKIIDLKNTVVNDVKYDYNYVNNYKNRIISDVRDDIKYTENKIILKTIYLLREITNHSEGYVTKN